MLDLIKEIKQTGETEIEDLVKAVLWRCEELFPGREISVFSIQRNSDRNGQLDSIIELLQRMKERE